MDKTMLAILMVALMVFTAVLVGLSLTDSILRARRALHRLQFERGQLAGFDNGVDIHWRTEEARKTPAKLTLVSSVKRPRGSQPQLAAAA